MKQLEAICRAMRDSEPGMENKSWRYWLPSARAALVALADADLDEPMINAGWEDDHGTDDFDREFRRLLRFIANEGKADG